jgi:hypothetical protein
MGVNYDKDEFRFEVNIQGLQVGLNSRY